MMRRYKQKETMSWPWVVAVVISAFGVGALYVGRVLVEIVDANLFGLFVMIDFLISLLFVVVGIVWDILRDIFYEDARDADK